MTPSMHVPAANFPHPCKGSVTLLPMLTASGAGAGLEHAAPFHLERTQTDSAAVHGSPCTQHVCCTINHSWCLATHYCITAAHVAAPCSSLTATIPLQHRCTLQTQCRLHGSRQMGQSGSPSASHQVPASPSRQDVEACAAGSGQLLASLLAQVVH